MTINFEDLKLVLDDGTKNEKIQSIESLTEEYHDPRIIQLIISKLGDEDMQVRGEAFSSLVLNENNIAKYLIENLGSEKNTLGVFLH